MLKQKVNTVLIEKNQARLKTLQSQLKKNHSISIVGTTTQGNTGFSLITNYAPQLVFINVELSDINGLEFVKILYNRNIFPEVVFVADDEQFAYDSLYLEPLDFLVTPITTEDLDNMLIRLKQKLKKKELMRKMDEFTKTNEVRPKRIFKEKHGIFILELSEIVFIKALLTRSLLTLITGKEIELKTSLNQTMEIINSEDFIRINRSYSVNRNYLRKIDRQKLKCHMFFQDFSWEVPASKNTIRQLEKLNTFPVY